MEHAHMPHASLAAETMPPQGVQWRLFVRALAEEVDSLAGPGERDDMLRGIGRRIARMAPLPPVDMLDALEMEMNDALEELGWGRVQLHLNADDRAIIIRHHGLPRVGSLGSPPGTWLASLLEGLYEGWMGQQPGHHSSLVARRVAASSGEMVTLRFARA
jgi:hypothetical protein